MGLRKALDVALGGWGLVWGHLLWRYGVTQAFKPYCQFPRTEELIKQGQNQQSVECGKL